MKDDAPFRVLKITDTAKPKDEGAAYVIDSGYCLMEGYYLGDGGFEMAQSIVGDLNAAWAGMTQANRDIFISRRKEWDRINHDAIMRLHGLVRTGAA